MPGIKDEMPKIEGEIKNLIEELGYDFVGMELVHEHGRMILRIYINTVGGINIKDCEIVSRRVGKLLDAKEELFGGRYYLEVSSPGLDAPLFYLKDYKNYKGKTVRIKTDDPIRSRRNFKGKIVDVLSNNDIQLLLEDDTYVLIPFKNISKARLVPENNDDK